MTFWEALFAPLVIFCLGWVAILGAGFIFAFGGDVFDDPDSYPRAARLGVVAAIIASAWLGLALMLWSTSAAGPLEWS